MMLLPVCVRWEWIFCVWLPWLKDKTCRTEPHHVATTRQKNHVCTRLRPNDPAIVGKLMMSTIVSTWGFIIPPVLLSAFLRKPFLHLLPPAPKNTNPPSALDVFFSFMWKILGGKGVRSLRNLRYDERKEETLLLLVDDLNANSEDVSTRHHHLFLRGCGTKKVHWIGVVHLKY